jgi:hypothetical protein
MHLFDRVVLLALVVFLAGFAYLAMKAAYRYYHWRRSLRRIERREWVRRVRSLGSGEQAY